MEFREDPFGETVRALATARGLKKTRDLGQRWTITHVLIAAVLIAFSEYAQARGIWWSYEIVGIALDKSTRLPLVNQTIIVDRDTVTTDGEGRFRARVGGSTCDRGSSWTIRRCNAKHNNKITIQRVDGAGPARIRSKWKRYGLRPILHGKERKVRYRNLHLA